jgi:hypothetical protein
MKALHSTMNRPMRLSVVVAGLLMIVACASSTAPTTTLPTTTTVTTNIAPANTALQIGQTQAYTLTTATSGSVVTWISSNSGVLSIDATGLATAITAGASTITATSDSGTSSTLTVEVVPSYQGSWTGTSTVLSCTDLDGLLSAGYCAHVRGSVAQWTLILTQTGLTLSGTMTKSEGGAVLSGNVTGTIGASGDIISINGPLAGLVNGQNLTLTPISWDSFASGTIMTGSWAANVTSAQTPGTATVQWSLTGAMAISATAGGTAPVSATASGRRRGR